MQHLFDHLELIKRKHASFERLRLVLAAQKWLLGAIGRVMYVAGITCFKL